MNGITYIEATYRYGGECDFNFNEKKYSKFKEIIDENADALERLKRCKENHHTLLNFSLMQSLGNMQSFKGADPFDRLDIFIYKLDKYLSGNSNEIINFSSKSNRPYLISYLNEFKNIYEYCETIYFIDSEEFVNRIIMQGDLPIKNCSDVIRYMNLAEEFWSRKQSAFEKIYSKVNKNCEIDMFTKMS